MRLIYDPRAYLMAFMCALLMACQSLGLPTPETFNEKLAAAQGTVTQIRVSATTLLTAGKITSADGTNVLKSTDAAAEGIAVARVLSAQNMDAAQSRLTATVTVLAALQAYLATRSH